jgi:hypothetical protein
MWRSLIEEIINNRNKYIIELGNLTSKSLTSRAETKAFAYEGFCWAKIDISVIKGLELTVSWLNTR